MCRCPGRSRCGGGEQKRQRQKPAIAQRHCAESYATPCSHPCDRSRRGQQDVTPAPGRPTLHPWPHGHLGVRADGVAMLGNRAPRERSLSRPGRPRSGPVLWRHRSSRLIEDEALEHRDGERDLPSFRRPQQPLADQSRGRVRQTGGVRGSARTPNAPAQGSGRPLTAVVTIGHQQIRITPHTQQRPYDPTSESARLAISRGSSANARASRAGRCAYLRNLAHSNSYCTIGRRDVGEMLHSSCLHMHGE